MKTALAVSLALLAWAPAWAGELLFANGTRMTGELSNEALMVSTGSGLVEIAPDEVVALSREEIRLRDGRVVRGTLVGGQLKARTSVGEIAVKVDELQSYRATGEAGTGAAPAVASQPAASPGTPAPSRNRLGGFDRDRGGAAHRGGVPGFQEQPPGHARGRRPDGGPHA